MNRLHVLPSVLRHSRITTPRWWSVPMWDNNRLTRLMPHPHRGKVDPPSQHDQLELVPPSPPRSGKSCSKGMAPDDFALLSVCGADPKTLLRLSRAVGSFQINVEGYHGSSGFYNDYRAMLRGERSKLESLKRWMENSMGDLFPVLQILDHDCIGTLNFEVPDAQGVVADTLELTSSFQLERHWDNGITYNWPFVGNQRFRQCIVLEFPNTEVFQQFHPQAIALAQALGSEDLENSILTRGVHLLAGV